MTITNTRLNIEHIQFDDKITVPYTYLDLPSIDQMYQDIVGVQPMTGQVGEIFTMNVRYTSDNQKSDFKMTELEEYLYRLGM